MKKVFITGATGYIGWELTKRLLSSNCIVHAYCRSDPDPDRFNHPNLKIFKGDLLDLPAIERAMTGCEEAFHLAAYARVWAKHPETFFHVNVLGTVNILNAAQHTGVRKVVFTSTGGTFGASNGKPITEAQARTMDFFTEYESSKFIAEEQVQHFVRKGLDVSIVHPVRVYGPGIMTESNALTMMIKAYVEGNWHIIPGTGEAIGCFSFISDVVNGHLLAMENGKPGEKYILGGVNASFNEFFGLLKDITGKGFFMVRLPMPVMLLYGYKEELLARWFNVEPQITRKWIRKYNYNMSCSSEKAISELGYSITPLEKGVYKTLSWLEDEHRVYT
jgi:nucleoside-diphosphate-sugar epimerase